MKKGYLKYLIIIALLLLLIVAFLVVTAIKRRKAIAISERYVDVEGAVERALNIQLDAEQANSIRLITLNWAKYDKAADLRNLAYLLATSWGESRFKSVREIKAAEGTAVWEMQKRYWASGFYGRGLSALTWESSYRRFSPFVGIDLVANPDAIMNPEIGAKILVYSMLTGAYTGVGLPKYINAFKTDYYNARRTINGTFKAQEYANYASAIHTQLTTILA